MEDVNTRFIDGYLHALWEGKGSDLLLIPGAVAAVRIDGELLPIAGEDALTDEAMAGILWCSATQ